MTRSLPAPVSDLVTVPPRTADTAGARPGARLARLVRRRSRLPVAGRLVSGDTLFLEGCGRTDLPGSDPAQMYESLTQLAKLPDDTIVYPGHRYSVPSSGTMSAIRESNYVFRPRTADMWMQMFGGQ